MYTNSDSCVLQSPLLSELERWLDKESFSEFYKRLDGEFKLDLQLVLGCET